MRLLYVAGGDLDEKSVRQLRDVFDELAAAGQDVTIDMTAVGALDGSGLGAVVYLMKRLMAGGRQLSLVNVQDGPLVLMKSLGVANILVDDKKFIGVNHTVFDPTAVLTMLSTAHVRFKHGIGGGEVVDSVQAKGQTAQITHAEPAGVRAAAN